MREWMRKGLAWCLAAVLLLGLLPLSPRATAAEERDLSQAEIDLDEWFYRYDKSPKKPVPTVKLDGAVIPNTDYTVSYDNNTNAGQAAVTVTGTGAYFGSKTVHFTLGWSCLRRSRSGNAIRASTERQTPSRRSLPPAWTAPSP